MTPELKTACEVVFQEHKVTSQPFKWNNDAFRGRISIGLSEMAKLTLVGKNIIIVPEKSKKIITLLNPAVATAGSFEEAEKMIVNKVPALVASRADEDPPLIEMGSMFVSSSAAYPDRLLRIAGHVEAPVAGIRWYLKPLFYYVIWPICGAVAGALIAYLIGLAYTELFFDLK